MSVLIVDIDVQTPIETFMAKPDSWHSVVVADANRGGWSYGGKSKDAKGKNENKDSGEEDCDESETIAQLKVWGSVSVNEGKTWKIVDGTTTKIIKEVTTVINNKTLTATVTSTATVTPSPKVVMMTTVRQVEVEKLVTKTLLVNHTSIVTAVPSTVTVHNTDTIAVLDVSTVHDTDTVAVLQVSTVRDTDTIAVLEVSTVTPEFYDVVTAEAPTVVTAEATPTPEADLTCEAQPGDPAYALGPDGQLYATTVPHDPRHPPGPIITPGMLKANQECVPGSFRCINSPIGWEACTTEGDWTVSRPLPCNYP